jgi:hypothetical protein
LCTPDPRDFVPGNLTGLRRLFYVGPFPARSLIDD